MKFLAPTLGLFAMGLVACSGSGSNDPNSNSPTTNYAVNGKLASLTASSKVMKNGVTSFSTKTITHVMAISPKTSSPERFVGEVGADGSFTLGINTGSPYIFVFIDDSKIGEDMIVGIFNPGDAISGLDTLVPAADGGSLALGNVTVDGSTQQASMSTTFNDFLAALGIDSTTAATIGEVDDLSLRSANPDIDSNGKIDALEGTSMWLDFHVRSKMSCTTYCPDGRMSFDAFNGSYLTDTAGFGLASESTSIYAVHSNSFDSTPMSTYISSSGSSTTLSGGASWTAADMPGGGSADIGAHKSFSFGEFSDLRQWGPDFALDQAGVELPGYDHPVKLVWTMGSKSMTYTHVRTRAKSGLFSLVPDFKINVDSDDAITSIDYRWRRWNGSMWVAASTSEVQLLVADETASIIFSTVKSGGVEEGLRVMIPTDSSTGTIAWTSANVEKTAGVTQDAASLKLSDFCGGVSSYDDKLGLRIFAYAFNPTSSSSLSACP